MCARYKCMYNNNRFSGTRYTVSAVNEQCLEVVVDIVRHGVDDVGGFCVSDQRRNVGRRKRRFITCPLQVIWDHVVQQNHLDSMQTKSPAVAERPRDASCLSAVSFNSTIRRSQSSIIGYFGFRFTAAYNWILFSSLRRIHYESRSVP